MATDNAAAHRLQIAAEPASVLQVRLSVSLCIVQYSSRRLGASLSYGGSAPGDPTQHHYEADPTMCSVCFVLFRVTFIEVR